MNIGTWIARLTGALLLGLAAPWAGAGYFVWDAVELPASSGAACGNGTPYRFFVNRTPFTRNTVIVYEGGGACWDQKSCKGEGKLSAVNPDGIPADYLAQANSAAGGLVTPFSARLDPFQSVQTQSWNIVYLPYCTGDVHSGNKLAVYADSDPASPRVQYHRGHPNVREAARWMRAHMGRPAQLLLTGFSAGGVGSTTTYALVRDLLQPTGRASLLADSGPLMPAPRGASPQQYPSLPLHERIRSAWGLDEPQGLVTQFAATMPGFDPDDLGTVNTALAQRYPADRFGYMAFQADGNFSAFSYEKFFPDIAGAPTPEARMAALLARWQPDLARWTARLQQQPNVAFHLPYFRNFNESHCLTIVDFSGTGIEDKGIASLSPFVDNTLNRGVPMRNAEEDRVSDLSRPLSLAVELLKFVLGLFG
ncbi:MAG: pectin acetylesterase-family hydrolase [Pseudomonadota bacterium]